MTDVDPRALRRVLILEVLREHQEPTYGLVEGLAEDIADDILAALSPKEPTGGGWCGDRECGIPEHNHTPYIEEPDD